MNKISKISNYLYILVGFFILTYILYIRIFLVRIPKDLHVSIFDANYKIKIIFLLISITICLFIIMQNILISLNITKKERKLSVVLRYFSKVIEDSLKHFFSFILSFYNNRYYFILKLSQKFYTYFSPYPEYYLLFAMYFVRITILATFLLEVFLKFRLDYFYKSLTLLCIILLIRFLIFILRDFASNLDVLREALIITDKGIDEETQLPITSYSLSPEYKDNDLHYVIEQFIICNKLSGYLNMYDRYYSFFNPKFNIILYTLYFMAWLYVLYYNIYF